LTGSRAAKTSEWQLFALVVGVAFAAASPASGGCRSEAADHDREGLLAWRQHFSYGITEATKLLGQV
jgi:hypothetical protein